MVETMSNAQKRPSKLAKGRCLAYQDSECPHAISVHMRKTKERNNKNKIKHCHIRDIPLQNQAQLCGENERKQASC